MINYKQTNGDLYNITYVMELVSNYGNLYYTGTMLRENKVLTSLRLWCCELGPHGVSEVCNAVGMNTTLTSLDLSQNTFDDQSIASLGK